MDYEIFEQMTRPEWKKAQEEEEQAYMERILQHAFLNGPEDGKEHIYEKMKCQYRSSDFRQKILTVDFPVQEWELNSMETLHGGVLVTAVDMTCGMLVRFMKQSKVAVTVQLSINFLRPIPEGTDFEVCAEITKMGERIIFLTAKVKRKDTGQITATASGTFV